MSSTTSSWHEGGVPRSAAQSEGPCDLWLISELAQSGLLTAAQAADLSAAGTPAWQETVRRGYFTDRGIVETLANRFKVPIADLERVEPRAAGLLPETIARKYQVVAIGADDRLIRIATADPRDLALEQTLAFITGREVLFMAAAPASIAEKIEEIYRPTTAINRLVERLERPATETLDEAPRGEEAKDATHEGRMARLVAAMIAEAVRERASDIQCEPLAEGTSIRYRIDGVLREVMRIPPAAGPALVRRIKIISQPDVTDPLRLHDGRGAVRVDGKAVDLRISTVPVARRGEKALIRILDRENVRASIADLELPADAEAEVERILAHRDGIVLAVGPTGSGKTATLYAALNQLRTGKINIVTVEDPVEYDVPGISQLQVNEAQGLTFATALRSVLRQDPDVVLVGEIRDPETATIATQASLSGHLVLSALHANDGASAVVRLRDLGVDPLKIASALRGVIAQRLVRRICPECSRAGSVDDFPAEARPPASYGGRRDIRRANGCKACGGTGYRGRIAVLEIMRVDERVGELIADGAHPDALVAAARRLGMKSLRENGLERVWAGETTLTELARVLGDPRGQDDAGGAAPDGPGELPGAQVGSPQPRAAATRADRPSEIVVADDDPQMRRLVRMILEREGHRIVEAADGLDALDRVESGSCDLMLLDLDMPRLDGIGVLEELRARVLTSSIPVIVLTSRTGESEIKTLDLGAQDFLAKPFQPGSLQARVRAVLRRTRMG